MSFSRILFCLGTLAVLVGCDKKEIKTYRVSKEPETSSRNAAQGSMNGADASQASVDSARTEKRMAITQAPANWEAQPRASMREASFLVKGEGGAIADVSLIILGGGAGTPLDNVNRWRSQLGQAPVSEDQLANTSQRLTTALGEVTVVEVEGLPEGADPAKDGKILAAIAKQAEGVWFFKIRGNAPLVSAEKEHFLEWVRSARAATEGDASSVSAPAAASGMEASSASDSAKPQIRWNVPEGWKTLPASQMRYASFAVEGANGEKADISVVTLPGESGGDLANVNRWRQQLGLPPVTEAELKSLVVPVGEGSTPISTMDLAGSDRRMLVGWLRNSGQSWFFKLAGPPALVGSEKEKFMGFLRSVKF